MSNCANSCKLCNKLIISNSVTVTGGNLVVNIPTGVYGNGKVFCIIIAQTIPSTATINMPVVITIGSAATLYPLADKCGTQLVASEIRTRTRYKTIVMTTTTGGSFRICGKICNRTNTNLASLPATVTAPPTTT